MNRIELARRLAASTRWAPRGQKVNTYVMFGIRYAGVLPGRIQGVVDDARLYWPDARVTRSATTDIQYGVRLAAFVALTDEPPNWLE